MKSTLSNEILTEKEITDIFFKSLEGTPQQYSSNLNPLDMFKRGYMEGQKAKGILLPSNEDIKAHSPYYGKSCNKHWFEGALWLKVILKG